MRRLYADSIPFYVRDLSLYRFWYLWWGAGSDSEGQLYIIASKHGLQVLFFLRNFSVGKNTGDCRTSFSPRVVNSNVKVLIFYVCSLVFRIKL